MRARHNYCECRILGFVSIEKLKNLFDNQFILFLTYNISCAISIDSKWLNLTDRH